MKVLIIEDEYHAARRLEKLLLELQPNIQILESIDSIENAVNWLRQNPAPELAFIDIQLADGLSFEIFKQVEFKAPVIFTTAYDQYTLKAFKVNSIDYLLKPVEEEELATAIQKFQNLLDRNQSFDSQSLMQAIQSFQTKKHSSNVSYSSRARLGITSPSRMSPTSTQKTASPSSSISAANAILSTLRSNNSRISLIPVFSSASTAVR